MNAVGGACYRLDEVRVLVLDDNRHMRNVIRLILRALGTRQICEASFATDALEELQHFAADVIITDWYMEPLDGLEFVRRVRTAENSANPYVPIIMLTGYTEYQQVCSARDAGVTEFLAKPVSPKALYERLASIIDNPRFFVRTNQYFGPDRRRRDLGPPPEVPERRKEEIEKAKRAENESAGITDQTLQ